MGSYERARVSIALPDSLLSDCSSLLEKSLKLGRIARACSIFCVSRIYIYRDASGEYEDDARLAKLILEYLETPQYLRKRVFGKVPELRYVGMLPPLGIPHHKPKVPPDEIEVGEEREGYVISSGRVSQIDIGLDTPAMVRGRLREGERVTVRIVESGRRILAEPIPKREVSEYWGYEVKRVGRLSSLLRSMADQALIMTSRRGASLADTWSKTVSALRGRRAILVAFGSPERGLYEILADERRSPEEFTDLVVNAFPGQCVRTVRLEEAVLAFLSILNLMLKL